jgi:hypothetical protein
MPGAGAVPVLLIIVAVAAAGARAVAAQPAAAPELRSPTEAAQLVADAKRIHVNTLIVQVRAWNNALPDHADVVVTARGVARAVLDWDRRGE